MFEKPSLFTRLNNIIALSISSFFKKPSKTTEQGNAPLGTPDCRSNPEPSNTQIEYFFYPDYNATNPYQNLLYKDFSPDFTPRAGDLPLAIEHLQDSTPNRRVIFHLHWTNLIIGDAQIESDANARKNAYLEMLLEFISKGGIFIWTIHNIAPHEVKFPQIEFELCTELGKLASVIHVHSQRVIKLVESSYPIPAEKLLIGPLGNYIGVYPNTIACTAARQTLGFADDDFVFLFTGLVRNYKGLDELLEVFKIVRGNRQNVKLLIAGQPMGVDIDDLKNRIAETPGVKAALHFIPDSELQIYLNSADFMVLPYRKILTSSSIYLSLSFGIPVIAPNAGILPDVLDDNVNAFLYNPSDQDGLMNALERALSCDLAPMRQAAMQRAETLTWDRTRAALLQSAMKEIHT